MAADMAPAYKAPLYKAPIAPVSNWTGFYIGGDIGGAWTTNTATWNPQPSPAAFGANAIAAGVGGSSVTGGFHIGYNWQFAPTWVTGLEGDWSWANAKGSFAQPWTPAGGGAAIANSVTSMSSNLDWVSSLRGRLGYLLLPNLLAYGTGGVAWAHTDRYAGASFTNGYAANSVNTNTQTGFAVGGGLEWAITNNWLLRGEYLFYRFDGTNVTATAAAFPAGPSNFVWNNLNVNVARVGLSYKF